MSKIRLTAKLLLLQLTLSATSLATTYYVSPEGTAENTGTTESAPLNMVQTAVDKMSTGDTLIVLDGIYTGTLKLKSGITIKAQNPRKAIFSGAEPLTTTFQKHTENIYKTEIKKSPDRVFYKGQPLTWARWPNMNWSQNWNRGKKWITTSSLPGKTTAKQLTQLKGKDLTDAYIFLRYSKGNSCYSRKIKSFTGTTIAWDEHNFYNRLFTGEDGKRGAPHILKPGQKTRNIFFLVGALDLLDAPGEWFAKDNTLYLYSPDGIPPTPADTLAQTNDYAIHSTEPLTDITIDGIDLFATSLKLSNPENKNITFRNTHFTYIGGSPLFENRLTGKRDSRPIDIKGSHITIDKCLFAGAQNTALNLVGADITVNNSIFIENNRHANFESNGLFLAANGTYNITNNTLFNNCSDAIRIAYTDDYQHTKNPQISHNNIFNAGIYNSDVSGIYFPKMTQHNAEFHHNWVHNVKGNGIRLDLAGEELSVHHNLFWSSKRGMSIEGYGKFNIYNNTSVRNKEACDIIRNVISKKKGSNPDMVNNDLSFAPISDWNALNNLIAKFADSVGPSELGPFTKSTKDGILHPERAKRKSLPVIDRGSVKANITGFKNTIFTNGNLAALNLVPTDPIIQGGATPTPELIAQGVTSLDTFRGAYGIGAEPWRTGSDWMPYSLQAPDTMAAAEQFAKRYKTKSITPEINLTNLSTGKLSELNYQPTAKPKAPAKKPIKKKKKKKAPAKTKK